MAGWTSQVQATHDAVQRRIAQRTPATNQRNPDVILRGGYPKPKREPDVMPNERFEAGYSPIDVDRVMIMSKSGKAWLMLVEGDETWVPLSVIREGERIYKGDMGVEIDIATWFAKKQGWATT